AALERAGLDCLDVRNRAVRALGDRDQPGDAAAAALLARPGAGWVADDIGDQPADRIVGAGDASGADPEEAHFLSLAEPGGRSAEPEQQRRRKQRAHSHPKLPSRLDGALMPVFETAANGHARALERALKDRARYPSTGSRASSRAGSSAGTRGRAPAA